MSHDTPLHRAAARAPTGRGGRWQAVDAGAVEWLRDGTVDWTALETVAGATLVKENAARQVWRVSVAGRALFAKVFRGDSLALRVRQWLGITPEQTEWRAARYAAHHAVGCVRLIAYLRPAGSNAAVRAVLISEEEERARSLDAVWQELDRWPARQRRERIRLLTEQVARLLANAHRNGFRHLDLHPGNILVSHNAAGVPVRAVFVDVQRARVGVRVNFGRALADLAQFGQWFTRRATAMQQLRFLRAYLLARQPSEAREWPRAAPDLLRDAAKQIDVTRRRQARRLYAHRDRRVFGQNRYFATRNLAGGWRATFTLRFRRRDLAPRPSQPDRSVTEWLDWLRVSVPDPDDAGQWNRAAAGMGVQAIRHTAGSLGARLAWTIGGSPGRRMFRDGHRARNRGQGVASPIALFERRRRGLVAESVLLAERTNRGT